MAALNQTVTDAYALYHGDSCEILPTLPDKSVGLSIYSPPFCGLYNYSSSERDLSNCRSYPEFFEHYAFIVEQIHRLTKAWPRDSRPLHGCSVLLERRQRPDGLSR